VGFTAVLLDSDDPTTSAIVATIINGAGGRIAIITDNVLIGWIDPALDRTLVGQHHIARIIRSRIAPTAIPARSDRFGARQNEIAASFFNAVIDGVLAAQVERGLAVHGTPLVNDVVPIGSTLQNATTAVLLPGRRHHLREENLNGPPWTNEQMTGLVKVNVFEVQSDGTIETSRYHWTLDDQNSVTNQALAGLSFWANQAANYNRGVTFSIGVWEPYNGTCNEGYEPIFHAGTDDYLWINEVMRKFDNTYYGGRPGGYGASPVTRLNVRTMVEQFNYDQEHIPGNWTYNAGFAVFVAYNPPALGAPDRFTDGLFGFTVDYGGPWVQLLFNMDGWGTNNLNRIMTHETGHCFWACDEYYQPGYATCGTCGSCRSFGPRLDALNRNCNNPNLGCAVHETCMMQTNDFALCDDTPTQIGWRE
jgi:hypothetical protein